MALFRLIRFPNLLIVALTQYLLYYRILIPVYNEWSIQAVLDSFHFSQFVFVTLILTAGGYIINDIIDLPIDRINKPNRYVIERKIALSTAYWLYYCIHLIGLMVAINLAFYVENPRLILIYPLAAAGLYFYSSNLKKQPLIGNFVVAAFCAGVAGIILFAERLSFAQLEFKAPEAADRIWIIFLGYSIFAFLSTMFREIVKDLEDVKGDAMDAGNTTPIAWGELTAKRIAIGFGVSLLLFILLLTYQYQDLFTSVNIILLGLIVVLPLIFALFRLWGAKSKIQYYWLSQLAKYIMLGGILLLFLIK